MTVDSIGRVGRTRLLAVLLAVVVCSGAVAHFAPTASAGIFDSNPACRSRLLQPYNSANYSDRCMGGFYQVTQVVAFSVNDYYRCAIAKNSSNGSGGDAIAAACGTSGTVITPCHTVAHHYPGVVNRGANAHTGYSAWHASSTADC